MKTTLRLILDRVEEGTAVLLSTEAGEEPVQLSAEALAVLSGEVPAPGDCYLCEVEDGAVITAQKGENPQAGENQKRLSALFKKRADRPKRD